MERNATRQMTRICHEGGASAETCADSDNRADVAEKTELSILADAFLAYGLPADGVKAAVGRLAILRSTYRAGEITESAMDARADVILRRLFDAGRRLAAWVRS